MAAAMAITAGAAGVIGSLRQGKQEAQMAEFNANVARQNAATVEQQATENARRSLVNNNKLIGSQKAAYAASGVSGGSALDVLQDTAAKGELDAITIKNKGDIAASSYQNEAGLNKYRASNALTSSYINAAGAATSAASKYASIKSGGES